jgi:hypothetical protein
MRVGHIILIPNRSLHGRELKRHTTRAKPLIVNKARSANDKTEISWRVYEESKEKVKSSLGNGNECDKESNEPDYNEDEIS